MPTAYFFFRDTRRKHLEILQNRFVLLTLPCSFSKSHSRSCPYGIILQLNVSCKLVPDATNAISVRPSVRQALWNRSIRSSCGRSRKPVYRICKTKKTFFPLILGKSPEKISQHIFLTKEHKRSYLKFTFHRHHVSQNCSIQEYFLQFACFKHEMTLTGQITTTSKYFKSFNAYEFVVTADAHRHHDHQHTDGCIHVCILALNICLRSWKIEEER